MHALKSKLARLQPDWMQDTRPDPLHPHRRRFTACYRRKKNLVRSLWIVSGLIMLLQGANPAFVLCLALATTFMAFCILDETH